MQCVCPCRKKTIDIVLLLVLILCVLAGGCAPPEEPAAGSLLIDGDAAENQVSFTWEELKSMEEGLVEAEYFSINSYGSKDTPILRAYRFGMFS